jgi:hypothetical protein
MGFAHGRKVAMKKQTEGSVGGEVERVAAKDAEVRAGAADDDDEDEEEDQDGEEGPALDELEIWEASSLDVEDLDDDEDPALSSMHPTRR